MKIDIACNNPDNGLFLGQANAIHIGHIELESDNWNGYKFSYLDGNRVRLNRRTFEFNAVKEWFGNWCWNRYDFEREEARKLIKFIRKTGYWRCVAGPDKFFDWFNGNPHPYKGHEQ